ncbi:hypothetical protein EG329_000249 [Mollisiaceae sp. DMI_Dod_QoI]|nr:hypothetical protein EG329_000249 [Helotiales sp. DMI_Dod_QoI]
MPRLPSAPTTVAAAAGLLTAGAYLNAKLGISYDLRVLRNQKGFRARMLERSRELGDDLSLYRFLEPMPSVVDALAQYLVHHGIQFGQVVGILATNSPELAISMFAISKIGGVSAMLNTALKSETLSHCIKVANTKVVIATPDLVNNVPSAIGSNALEIFSINLSFISPSTQTQDQETPYTVISPSDLTPTSLSSLPTPPPQAQEPPNTTTSSIYLLLFTSGTTGPPKAVSIPKLYLPILATHSSLDLRNPSKYLPIRTYSCLPLFHATALLGFVSAMGTSSCYCISRHFSASKFSRELCLSRATRMMYVGEICRYLLAAPPSPSDKNHTCIVALGNGLQKDVWERFQTRFLIPEIREVYRSSEGLYKFDNLYGGKAAAGNVGFQGWIGRGLENDTFLLRVDPETGDLWRDSRTGFCVEAGDGEPGEAVARVGSLVVGYPAYFGDREATEGKLVRDVFCKGDLFQRSGDLLVREGSGWVRFLERVGETWRWKGENVSAGEVKRFMVEVEGVFDIVVCGMRIDG